MSTPTASLLVVKLTAPSDARAFVKQGLLNAVIPVEITSESEEQLHLRMPETIQNVSVLLHLIEAKLDSIQGEVTLSDGKGYKLIEKDLSALRKRLVEAMTRPQAAPPPNLWWLHFLPELRGLLKEMTGLIRWYPRAAGAGRQDVARNFTVLIFVIIIGVGILTYVGRISGDAFVFVIGILLGYVFSFLQRYLGLTAGPE